MGKQSANQQSDWKQQTNRWDLNQHDPSEPWSFFTVNVMSSKIWWAPDVVLLGIMKNGDVPIFFGNDETMNCWVDSGRNHFNLLPLNMQCPGPSKNGEPVAKSWSRSIGLQPKGPTSWHTMGYNKAAASDNQQKSSWFVVSTISHFPRCLGIVGWLTIPVSRGVETSN